MSKSNNKIPFKVSNNKNSPYNMNEIDITLLMSNPKHIHKMMGKEDVIEDTRKPLTFFKEEGSKMLSKRLPKKEKDDIPEFAPYAKKKYSDKREYNKAGELLNKGVRTMQDSVGKGYDKGKELISDFIKDSKKDGVGETLRDRGNNIKHIIDEYVKNNEFLQKANRGAKKANKALGIDKYLNKEKDYE